MKDNFSTRSDQYAKYRPGYPPELFDYLDSLVPGKKTAWDCGTGNGQVAYELAKLFDQVYATDISAAQMEQAPTVPNIFYSVQPAEQTDFPEGLFDLVVVAQAIHWFDFEKFYSEVRRTSKPGALIAVTGYGRINVAPELDAVIDDFYHNVIGPYWDQERRYIEEHYTTIPFPFEEIEAPRFVLKRHWTLEHLIGYLNTWSAVKHFIGQQGYNPVDRLSPVLERHWGTQPIREVQFPLLLRIGRIHTA
ncbi:class I SAM-dependent methyltransferase [Paraflavisolibacter sp. H34]|uniref:class I SAM-dependent methyltransferase n=1 Tax=Huijunlia imazamoxiresistens TaxID=3127457 RepID=UPI003015ECE0